MVKYAIRTTEMPPDHVHMAVDPQEAIQVLKYIRLTRMTGPYTWPTYEKSYINMYMILNWTNERIERAQHIVNENALG